MGAAGTTPEAVDVAIVGAGAAGIMMAAKLAEGGRTVVILEQGPELGPPDMVSSLIWARRLLQPGLVASAGVNPIGYYGGWGTGGSATHHYATWPRFKPDDFRMRTRFDRGADWPIGYDDLRPWYDKVQAEVGLSGDASAEIWRPPGAPYPMPPLMTFPHADRAAAGFRKLGHHVAPSPVAIASVPFGDRPACLYDNWCTAGCPIGALANPQFTYLPKARKAGATIRNDARATRVLTDPAGGRAQAVEYVDRDGAVVVQPASVVVLAGFVAGNVRLLLNSATDRHPTGLANASGVVGRGVMTHSLSNISALFDEDLQNAMGVPGGLLICQDGYGDYGRSDAPGSFTWAIGIAQKPNDVAGLAASRADLFGAPLHGFMQRAVRGLAKIQGMAEELPDPDNRVVLSDRKDETGWPAARIIHAFSPDTLHLFDRINATGLAVWRAAGAKEAWFSPRPATAHMAGGTAMGDDPRRSVTDSYGRTHDVGNLFVAGGSLFPTEAAVPPTFTVHALTWRAADHLLANWGTIAG